VNKSSFYKLKLERKKTKMGGISDLLQSVASSPTYILANNPEIKDLNLVMGQEDLYVSGKEQNPKKLVSFQGFQIYQYSSEKLKSTYIPWICNDGETRHLDVVYFSDSVEGLFLRINSSEGLVLKRVLDKDGYTLEDSN
jgi:hypothetical protein